jgi:hypothetical protein
MSDGFDVSESHIPLAALDATNVGPIQFASRRQALLGKSLLLPQVADTQSKAFQDVGSFSLTLRDAVPSPRKRSNNGQISTRVDRHP